MQKVPSGQVGPTGTLVMGSVMGTLVRDTVFIEEEDLKRMHAHEGKTLRSLNSRFNCGQIQV